METAYIPLERGAGQQTPRRIVIHAMAEFIDTEPDYHAVEWLRHLGLSAHAFINSSGVIIRSREDNQGAYHAKGFNTDSLGIEFLVPGVHTYTTFLNAIRGEYLTPEQYRAGVDLVKSWKNMYAIESMDRHSDLSPGRKEDPGDGFPWEQFLQDTTIESHAGLPPEA